MTKSSMRRLAAHPFLVRMKSQIQDAGKEPYTATVSFYGWPLTQDDAKATFARCRIVNGDKVLYGDPVEMDRKNIVEVRRI